jgi:hypothetical protein
MTKRWFLFSLLCITACLPQPKSDVQKAKPELLIQGRILHSSASLNGNTAIFIEQEPTAEAISAEDGSFALTLDEDRLEVLRLQYGLQDARLHLYFMSENGNPESAVLNVLNIQNRGAMNLGDIQLQAEIPVTGRIVAQGSPTADARVRLGRKEIVTAADGTFAVALPSQSATPLLVEKKGFVQTRGTWLPSNQPRDIELYNDLNPMGSIEAQPILRTASNQPLSLSYSANSPARWIRFANNPGILSQPFVSDALWQDLGQPLQIMPAVATIYYQFADRDHKILGPVMSYTPILAME